MFNELSLDKRLVSAIEHLGFEEPTDIQKLAIPTMMAGHDVLASSKTGSGKTLAYLLPALQRVMRQKPLNKRDPRVLILAPTRELAKQVFSQLKLFTAAAKYKSALILGGENFNDQVKALAKEPEFIVATPGRLADHLGQGHFYLHGLELLIFDEADRMLDLGFAKQLKQLHEAADHRKRQTVMFSATLNHEQVNEFALDLLNAPKRITVDSANAEHKDINQSFYLVDSVEHKLNMLEHMIKTHDITQLIVFTATRADTESLAEKLNNEGYSSLALSGELSQSQRNKIMESFSKGQHKVLITTDLASRGLDLINVSHVINFDLPKYEEEYVHRIGRTGRAGQKGIALSFVGPKDWKSFKNIELFLSQEISFSQIAELPAKFKGLKEKPKKVKIDSTKENKPHKPKKLKTTRKTKVNKTFITGVEAGDMPIKKKAKPQILEDDDE